MAHSYTTKGQQWHFCVHSQEGPSDVGPGYLTMAHTQGATKKAQQLVGSVEKAKMGGQRKEASSLELWAPTRKLLSGCRPADNQRPSHSQVSCPR